MIWLTKDEFSKLEDDEKKLRFDLLAKEVKVMRRKLNRAKEKHPNNEDSCQNESNKTTRRVFKRVKEAHSKLAGFKDYEI